MGTRFLLTQESTVPQAVKQYYLDRAVTDTVVTAKIDGVPHRVLRTEFTDALDKTNAVTSLPRALRNALAFKRESGQSLVSIVREGVAMKRNQELSWSQVVMAANTPMLLKAAMVEGRPDLGVMSSGQVVGVIDDLPSAREVVERVMAEADAVLGRLT
jgi:NAD(P)H-dependent flavin oxidoreductase YrpB (nitropropane dioxygenase family)